MQCGLTRYTAAAPAGGPGVRNVVPHFASSHPNVLPDARIQDVFRAIASDRDRTRAIARETTIAYEQGRKILVLTQRTQHLAAIQAALFEQGHMPFVLHGRMPRKQRTAVIGALNALPPDAARIVLATGKLVGEGFDHPPLDTLILAMPISWQGTLQQYAGRLHRQAISKHDVRIIDSVDSGHRALLHMWKKRQRGYRAMGCAVTGEGRDTDAMLL